MASRKINRVGSSTLTVSLPSKWAKTHSLSPGEELEVYEDGSALVITTQHHKTPKKVTIHLSAGQPFMRRYLTVMYRDGYDEIEITSEEELDQTPLKSAIDEMLGFEIVESYPKRVVVRNIATPNESEFHNIFRRLFLLNISIARATLEDIKSKHHTHTKEIAELEKITNKFCFFCQRVLTRTDLASRSQTLNTYPFASELEQMADQLKRICATLFEEKTTLSPQVVRAFENMLSLLENMYDHFYTIGPIDVMALRSHRNAVFDEVYALFHQKGLRGPELEIASLMLSVLCCIKEIETETVAQLRIHNNI